MKRSQKRKATIDNNNRPATKSDIDELAQITANNFDRIDNRMSSYEQDVDKIRQDLKHIRGSQEAMLVVLEENNQLLKEVRRLPDRIGRLERSVFRR